MTKFADMTRDEKLALFGAWIDGNKIELQFTEKEAWHAIGYPAWDEHCSYRIAPTSLVPDSIDWSHVSPKFKFMARDSNGSVWLYKEKPSQENTCWLGRGYDVKVFASYKQGTVNWEDSLVKRSFITGNAK